jgi:putative toxin-antitoxin system antitoxin component (TIGR02293 family)
MEKRDRVREPAASFGWSVDLQSPTVDDVIRRVEEGFDVQVLERFRKLLDISVDAAASLLGTSARTLARRQKEGHLQEVESDRLYRIIRLFERAVDVFGDEDDARRWLRQPQWGLGGAVPLEYARTDPGAREVEALLDRIDYGVTP